jgi:hypothetical protein
MDETRVRPADYLPSVSRLQGWRLDWLASFMQQQWSAMPSALESAGTSSDDSMSSISPFESRSPTPLPSSQTTQSVNEDNHQLPKRLNELYDRLERRGIEAVLPGSWDYDFPGLDPSLFVSVDNEMPYIRSLSSTDSSDFRGKLAFEGLLMIGKNIRAAMELNRQRRTQRQQRLEPISKRAIERFLAWAAYDADIHLAHMTLFMHTSARSVRAQRKRPTFASREDLDQLEERTQARLRRLAKIHRMSRPPVCHATSDSHPTLFFFALCGSYVGILALDSSTAERSVHTIMVADFSDAEQDLWNSLAITLTVMAARQECLESISAGVVPRLISVARLTGLLDEHSRYSPDEDV